MDLRATMTAADWAIYEWRGSLKLLILCLMLEIAMLREQLAIRENENRE